MSLKCVAQGHTPRVEPALVDRKVEHLSSNLILKIAGASAPSDLPVMVEPKSLDVNRVEQLELEKEQLNSSLFALTTRFAQIQFRLHQITEANTEDKDELLKELEDFAYRGCVDQQVVAETKKNVEENNGEIPENLKEKHEVIINELKAQLNDLESFAFKQGAGSVPQSIQLEKQQALIDQLAQRLNLNVDDEELANTSVDDLKSRVDQAVAEIVNPGKMKEKLVDHLQTQIQDLERFVEFLQVESEGDGHKSSGSIPNSSPPPSNYKQQEQKHTLNLIHRAMTIIQMFSLTHFACGGGMAAEETILVDTKTLIDALKRAVIRVRALVAKRMRVCDGESDSDTSSYSDDEEKSDHSGEISVADELTQAVRQDICLALQDILGNGLVHDANGKSASALTAPISCLIPRTMTSSHASEAMHPWEFILEYYELKHGPALAKNPTRMLTRAFNLEDLVSSGDDSHSQNTKASLLEAIHLVVNDHNPLKRSYDAMFKAFVCLGLNAGRLSRWIRLIFRSPALVSNHYNDSSYVARTGVEGVVTVLSKLDPVHFHLPVDVAVRPFKNIRDAF